MNLCDTPEWVQYLTVGLAVFPHLLTFVPQQYHGATGLVFKILNTVAANYGHCKNKQPVDQQDKVTRRPDA
jgi:uncharacterized membrane protein YfcA